MIRTPSAVSPPLPAQGEKTHPATPADRRPGARDGRRAAFHEAVFRLGIYSLAVAIPLSAAGCRICLTVLVVNWLAEGRWVRKVRSAFREPFMVLAAALYGWELLSNCFTHHLRAGLLHAETEASLLVIPLLLFGGATQHAGLREKAMRFFSAAVGAASAYCLVRRTYDYWLTKDASCLFYHALVAPLHQHAVYFSIYVFLALAWTLKEAEKPLPFRRLWTWLVIAAAWCGMLFLLRSKMVSAVAACYAAMLFVRGLRPGRRTGAFFLGGVMLLGMGAALVTANPLSRQMQAIHTSDLAILEKKSFDARDYLNEIQLRLVLWKFALETLGETRRWLTGVSPGDARYQLNRRIVQSGLYTGVPGTPDTGYLNYNLHNQFLETFFRLGAVGLALLAALLSVTLSRALSAKNGLLLAALGVFVCVCLTESVLERQIGIVPFFFFLCLLWPRPADTASAGPRHRPR